MKQIDSSDTTVQSDSSSSSTREHVSSAKRFLKRRNKVIKIASVITCMAILAVLYLLVNKNSTNRNDDAYLLPESNSRHLEIEVLDGIGNKKIAQSMTDYLRSQGYDVVEMRRNNDGIIERSYVLDRSGDLDAAKKIAAAVGIPQNKVFQKINRTLYLDVTVVIGKDFSQLKTFQSIMNRSIH